MSDLSYNDVQRAVQDGLRNIQSGVQRIVIGSSNINQQAQYLNDRARDVQEIKQMLQNIKIQMAAGGRSPTSSTGLIEQNMTSMQADMRDMKNRLTNIEDYLQQVSLFISQQHEKQQ